MGSALNVFMKNSRKATGASSTGQEAFSFYFLQMYAQNCSFTLAFLATFTQLSTNSLEGNTSFSILNFVFKWNLKKLLRDWQK